MKKKSWLKRTLLFIVVCSLVYVIGMLTLIISAQNNTPPQGVKVVVVLGARVNGEKPATPSLRLQERLDVAYTYLIENPESIVIVTGGQGSDESEPEGVVMGRYLEEKGIASDRIIVEKTSTSTLENLENAQALYPFDEVVVATSDFHVYRAKYIAESCGIKSVYTLSAPMQGGINFMGYFREIFALGYHLVFTH